jgi:DNA topoisomerase-1
VGDVLDAIREIHDDPVRCAEIAGLHYVRTGERGIRRRRHGRGFTYRDHRGRAVRPEVTAHIAELAIPPAWTDVWICADPAGHLQATGVDDRGRTQYLYHPQWREIRDVLNFYRLAVLGERLPTIREHVEAQLRRRTLDRERVIAVLLRVTDLAAIRIGTEEYAEENDSFGLTTLTKRHARLLPGGVQLAFPAKSGRRVRTVIKDRPVVRAVRELLEQRGRRQLFTAAGQPVTAADVNARLAELTGEHVTAKDFRTWVGTLAAFRHLRDEVDSTRSLDRVAVEAVDEAAELLGNTRAVARAHYVHPHMMSAFTDHRFSDYLDACRVRHDKYLDDDECALLGFLRMLLEREFDLEV